jgi:arsenic resistance protein ArsH
MRRAGVLADPTDPTPIIDGASFAPIDTARLLDAPRSTHAPRLLLLYGSLRKRSFSRLACEEAARILERLGAEARTFNPSGLPLPDDAETSHPKVQELRDLVTWSEGMGSGHRGGGYCHGHGAL